MLPCVGPLTQFPLLPYHVLFLTSSFHSAFSFPPSTVSTDKGKLKIEHQNRAGRIKGHWNGGLVTTIQGLLNRRRLSVPSFSSGKKKINIPKSISGEIHDFLKWEIMNWAVQPEEGRGKVPAAVSYQMAQCSLKVHLFH